MFGFERVLKATVMTTELFINSNTSKRVLYESLTIAQEFQKKYSAYDTNSLVGKINAAAGVKTIKCKSEDLPIFQKALEIAEISKGKFDPTIGVLTQGLYGFGKKNSKIPTKQELLLKKELVDYKSLQITTNSVYLKKQGMALDLGGIGKGFVCDKIIQHLLDNNATKALVSVGGEIVSFGKKYKIAIRDPFSKNNIAIIKTSKKALSISTSGDYERFIGSKKHHHILDSKTATQRHYYTSVTLIKNGIDATLLDGVATIVFNSPLEDLQSLAEKFKLGIIAITKEKKIIFENFTDIEIEGLELYPFA